MQRLQPYRGIDPTTTWIIYTTTSLPRPYLVRDTTNPYTLSSTASYSTNLHSHHYQRKETQLHPHQHTYKHQPSQESNLNQITPSNTNNQVRQSKAGKRGTPFPSHFELPRAERQDETRTDKIKQNKTKKAEAKYIPRSDRLHY